MSDRPAACGHCGTHQGSAESARECCAFEPVRKWQCRDCGAEHDDEYNADTCCGGKPSQRALEARGQMRMTEL